MIRYFTIVISNEPKIEANISIHAQHLEIYKKILRIKTDVGFRRSMKQFVESSIQEGKNIYVLQTILEKNLPVVLASTASNYLDSLFRELNDDVPEGEDTPNGEFYNGMLDISEIPPDDKIIQFSGKTEEQ